MSEAHLRLVSTILLAATSGCGLSVSVDAGAPPTRQELIWAFEARGFAFMKDRLHDVCERNEDCFAGLECVKNRAGWGGPVPNTCEIDCGKYTCPWGTYCGAVDHGPIVWFCAAR